MVWQCNHKFDGSKKCSTPHLDEETIRRLFIKAVNILTTEKDEIAGNFQAIKEQIFDTGELETKQPQSQEELDRTKAWPDEAGNDFRLKQEKREQIEIFLAELEQQDDLVTEFDEEQWYSLVDFVTVFNKEDIRFTFKDGTEVKV